MRAICVYQRRIHILERFNMIHVSLESGVIMTTIVGSFRIGCIMRNNIE